MDDFEEIMSAVSQEGVSAARPVIKILTKMWQSARDDLKEATARANRLRVVSILAAVLASICLACCVYLGSVIHRQQGEINAIHRILDEGVVVGEKTTSRSGSEDHSGIPGREWSASRCHDGGMELGARKYGGQNRQDSRFAGHV